MPTKVRDNSPERRKEEKKHSRSERDRSDKKERRHKSSTNRTSSTKEKTSSRTSLSPSGARRRASAPSRDDLECSPPDALRNNLPYPSFSKAHSKESVGSHPSLNIFTPPATDVDADKDKFPQSRVNGVDNGPPSPPLTDRNAGRPRTASSRGAPVETILEEEKETKAEKPAATLRTKSSRSDNHLRSSSDNGSTSPTKPIVRASTPLKRVETTRQNPQRSVSQPTRAASPALSVGTATELTPNDGSSDATSVAPEQPKIQRPESTGPLAKEIKRVPVPSSAGKEAIAPQQTRLTGAAIDVSKLQNSTTQNLGSPPPPPPAHVPLVTPKVDYLLHHGGLNQPIPKNFLYAGKPMAVQQAAGMPSQPPIVIANLFEPYNSLLSDFEKVIAKHGSLAVATGYRSVARRLLDRLEKVFSRDISSEECACPMCQHQVQPEDSSGISWGEILELVSGRRDLPNWPPFAFVATPSGLGISLEMQAPMQKMDIDVPEEYREHFIRQSRKTKQSVDKWLSRQGDDPSSPPEEVDDETLTFAILTHLPTEQRQPFKDLLGIIDRPLSPPRRAPSPDSKRSTPTPPVAQPRPRMHYVVTAGTAIQRLYRLEVAPRDPETAIFLLNNPALHNALATLAAISDDEWDILISGRFDGFLRSGAEDIPEPTNGRYTPARGPMRGTTPVYGSLNPRQGSVSSRQPTPATANPQHGAPIALDEETEIATLAEIEREIYVGMEQLEDAFEALHQRAEGVRRLLRDRSAGLAASSLRRRGPNASAIDLRIGTPASNTGHNWETDTDDGLGDWDGTSDIAPDDSASNISSARRRRPRRRNERRTPAMIDEEDEGDDSYADESERSRSPKKR